MMTTHSQRAPLFCRTAEKSSRTVLGLSSWRCRVRKGTGSQVDAILNKEGRAKHLGVGEAAVEVSGICLGGVQSNPVVCVLSGMLLRVFRYGQVWNRTCQRKDRMKTNEPKKRIDEENWNTKEKTKRETDVVQVAQVTRDEREAAATWAAPPLISAALMSPTAALPAAAAEAGGGGRGSQLSLQTGILAFPQRMCEVRRGSGIWVREAQWSFNPLSPKFAQNRGFPLKIA